MNGISKPRLRKISTIVIGCVALACSEGRDASGAAEAEDAAASVSILAPADGATLPSGPVTIVLGANGVAIVPAGTDEPSSGHHHLFVDREPTADGEAIPTGEGIVHLGAAQTEAVLEGLASGEHTVIAVLGDFLHRRIGTVATDTVRFTISP
jgi:hypothetical protein